MPRATAGTRARAGQSVSRSRRPGSRHRYPVRTELVSRRARRAGASRRLAEPGLAGLSHVDRRGKARMVDVSTKPDTVREARARITLRLRPATLRAIRRGEIAKGTPELIPLCHPLRLTGIDVRFTLDRARSAVHIETAVRTVDKTGVEME